MAFVLDSCAQLLAACQRTRSDSDDFYSPSLLGIADLSIPKYPLHGAIARGETAPQILHLIERIQKGGADQTDEKGFTPLAVACMKGHRIAMEALINKGAKLLAADQTGWTPLHYLQFTQNPFFNQMKEKLSKDQQVLSTLPERIVGPRTAAQLAHAEVDEDISFSGNNDRFLSLTLSNYSDFPQIQKRALQEAWETRFIFGVKNRDRPLLRCDDSLIQFLRHPPALSIRRNLMGMVQTYAEEPLQAGTVIRILSGELDLKSPSAGEYSSTQPWWIRGALNSTHFKNEGNLVRHGFPNCLVVSTEQFGIPLEVLVATEEIAQGTPLRTLLDETHPHRHLPPSIEEQEAVLETFRKTPILEMIKRIERLSPQQYKPEARIEMKGVEDKLNYLIESPHTLALLALKTDFNPHSITSAPYFKNHPLFSGIDRFLSELQVIKQRLNGARPDPFLNWLYMVPVRMVPSVIRMFAEKLNGNEKEFKLLLGELEGNYSISTNLVRYLIGEESIQHALNGLKSMLDRTNQDLKTVLGCLDLYSSIGKAGDAETTSRMNKLQAAFSFDLAREGKPLLGRGLASLIFQSDEEVAEIQNEIENPAHRIEPAHLEKGFKIRNDLIEWIVSNDRQIPLAQIMEGISVSDRIDVSNGIFEFIDLHRPDRKKQFILDFAAYSFENWDGSVDSLTPETLSPYYPASEDDARAIQEDLKQRYQKTQLQKLLTLMRKLKELDSRVREEKKD